MSELSDDAIFSKVVSHALSKVGKPREKFCAEVGNIYTLVATSHL